MIIVLMIFVLRVLVDLNGLNHKLGEIMVGNYVDEETGEIWCITLLAEQRDTNRKLDKIIELLSNNQQ